MLEWYTKPKNQVLTTQMTNILHLGICCFIKTNNNLRAEGRALWAASLLTQMKSWLQSPTPYKPGMGAAYKPDTQEVETGGSRTSRTLQGVEGQAGLETLCEIDTSIMIFYDH